MQDVSLSQLKAFQSIVETGTLEAAARQLHITPSAVSQRLKALEGAVGRILLERTKPARPTESGRAVLQLARQTQELVQNTNAQLDESHLSNVPLAINADSLATWVTPALAKVSHVATLEIFREDETRTPDLLKEGKVMAAITSVAEPLPGCRSTRLGTMRYRAYATRNFYDEWFSDGVNATTLASAPVLNFDRNDLLQDQYMRKISKRHLNPPRHYFPSTIEYSRAVQAGIGWGLIPEIQKDIDLDNLVELSPATTIDVKLYWQQWHLASDRLDIIASSVKEQAQRTLLPGPSAPGHR